MKLAAYSSYVPKEEMTAVSGGGMQWSVGAVDTTDFSKYT
jgi:hypothetical protein